MLENRADTCGKNISKMLVLIIISIVVFLLEAQPWGGVKRGKFHPLSDPGAHFRFEVSCIATFQFQNSMKINNLHALEGPCWVY